MSHESDKIYLHVPTFTIGYVSGNFISFMWNGVFEDSYFPILKDEGEWIEIGDI